MNITGTIYTTNKKGIATNSLGHIYNVIKTTDGVKLVKFDVVEIDLPDDVVVKKEKVAVRIDWDWLKSTYKTEGKVLGLHISRAEHNKLGLRHPNGGSLGGSYNRNIGDESMEFFIVANTKKDFIQKFLHELSHGFNHWTHGIDETHYYDYTLKNIESIYPTYSFIKNDLLTQLRDLAVIVVGLLKKKVNPTLHKRLPDPYNLYISQEYGVKNSAYKLTNRHIGIDYACPIGTPIYAVWDGEVTTAGIHSELGNYAHFAYTYNGQMYVERHLHMKAIPTIGKRKRGWIIGFSGDTGFSTGPHYHIDQWIGEVNLSGINKTNWNTLTVNPKVL